ncbi:MAG: hypothetical protein JJE15_00145 [Desulfobacteraceae bacterium]|nr:hypothetical protein [Desulfobacteraceae bacterium]
MRKVIIAIFTILAAFLLLCAQSAPTRSEKIEIDLAFIDQTLSAKITEAPLRAIIAKIKAEKAIRFRLWLKGKESLLDRKISVRFSKLPIEEGIERIFRAMNYSLIFNKYGKLVGVFLVGKKPDRRRYRARRRAVMRRRSHPRVQRR